MGGTDDAWKNTVATNANKNTNCCGQVATCGSKFYSCPVGYKKKANVATTACTGLDASSCATGATCCEKDTATCEGVAPITCPADKYYPAYLENSPAIAANKDTNCCAVKATSAVAT